MKNAQLPYVDVNRKGGKDYYYFRKRVNGKMVRKPLPDNPDSEEFMRAYWEIRNGKRNAPPAENWNALIVSYYGSAGFKRLATSTRENYRRHCEAIRESNGNKSVKLFRRKHAIAVRDALQDKWSKANERVAVLSILCKHAVDLEWIERNPVVDIAKLKGGEYEAWPDDVLAAFEGYCDEHGERMARTVYELCIGTGQRIGDCVAMRWDDFDGAFMSVIQEKTGTKIQVYCPNRLRVYLASLPKTGAHILAKNLTQPVGKRAAQKAVEEVRAGIGAMHGAGRFVPHGWRYTAAKQLAEAGCSDSEIQAVTGHKTLAMVQKYRAQANQKRASQQAQERREQNKPRT
ncbi:tyrosine recombinase XerC [Thioclava sp. GXIMD4215]|uniref:site-specific integrase n=1 Tax=Thioclava sp. GXIMD4215 TaxID=3131928 RepID=UPI0032534D91